jgi:hypothetical protein
MVNRSGQSLASVSGLLAGGADFTVTRSSTVAQPTPGNGVGIGRGRGTLYRVGIQGYVPGARRTNINTSTGVSTGATGTGNASIFAIRFGLGGFQNLQSIISEFQERETAWTRDGWVLFRR